MSKLGRIFFPCSFLSYRFQRSGQPYTLCCIRSKTPSVNAYVRFLNENFRRYINDLVVRLYSHCIDVVLNREPHTHVCGGYKTVYTSVCVYKKEVDLFHLFNNNNDAGSSCICQRGFQTENNG